MHNNSFNSVVAMVGKPWLSLGNYVITPLELCMFHALDVYFYCVKKV